MPRRPQHRDFTRSPKRKMSQAELRRRTASYPLAVCERCGESADLRCIETRHGPLTVCYDCRKAHQVEAARYSEMINNQMINTQMISRKIEGQNVHQPDAKEVAYVD